MGERLSGFGYGHSVGVHIPSPTTDLFEGDFYRLGFWEPKSNKFLIDIYGEINSFGESVDLVLLPWNAKELQVLVARIDDLVERRGLL
jgi:hypothetical protein